LEDQVIGAYEIFYSRVNNFRNYIFHPTPRQRKIIGNFVKVLESEYAKGSVGSDYMFKFFAFQFNYWHDKNTRFGAGKIMLEWVIGKTAVQRWKDRHEKAVYHSLRNMALMYGVNPAIDEDLSETNYLRISPGEEQEKNRQYSTDGGLLLCLLGTTLYNHRSKLCIGCKNKVNCRELLKANYPGIYIGRGYSKGKC